MMSKLLVTEGTDRRNKLSSFWVLIVLASVIASAGVMADSTATVIGAMIVAPLMTPILGTALSVVLADRRLILRNLGMVVAGAVVVILLAYLLGMTSHAVLDADTNSQIAARVSPRLIDLVAALATGVVGAFALVRISDVLPDTRRRRHRDLPRASAGRGGPDLESGAMQRTLGALLLFGTNVTAIIATGTIIFLAYRVRPLRSHCTLRVGQLRRGAMVTVLGSLLVLAVPLGIGSALVALEELVAWPGRRPRANEWAQAQVADQRHHLPAEHAADHRARSPADDPETGLREKLDEAGLSAFDAQITLVLGGGKDLPAR